MTPIRRRSVVVLLVTLVAMGTNGSWAGTPGDRVVAAQSLADVARIEVARREAVTDPGWVYNDYNLRPAPDRPTEPEPMAEPPTGTTAPEPDAEGVEATATDDAIAARAPGAGDKRTEADWRTQAETLTTRIARLRTSESGLESRVKELRRLTDGRRVGEAPAAHRETRRVAAALGKVQRDLASLDSAWIRLAEDAERAKVPADWLTPAPSPAP